MTTPMISVVMPVYNAEKYVAEAIESILNQSYSDFEFIIIDDCSTDNSYIISQDYAEKDQRIKLFRNDRNYKQAYTKNRAIAIVQGKYIAFMDADDISLPERFAKQIEFMESHPEVGVCGTYAIQFNMEKPNLQVMRVQLIHELIKSYTLFVCCNIIHPTVLLRRKLFSSECGFLYDEQLGGLAEDFALWTKFLDHQIVFANLDNILLKYRLSTTQTTNLLNKQISNFSQQLIECNLKKLFGEYYHPKLLKKHAFYIQNANFSKLLLCYLGFYFYKKQFINANKETKVLSNEEVSMFIDGLDPFKKLIYKAINLIGSILHG